MTTSSSPENKRRYPRLQVSARVEGRWRDQAGVEHPFKGLLLSISEGGVQIRTAEHIPANAAVRINIRLGLLARFSPTGRVRWWRRNGEVRDIGIHFAEPIRRIGELVEKELARQKQR
jgi:hypothetical protein